MKSHIIYTATLLGLILAHTPSFSSAQGDVPDVTLNKIVSFHSLMEDKDNTHLLKKSISDPMRLEILMEATKVSDEAISPYTANQVVQVISEKVAKTVKAFKDKRTAKQEIFAGLHDVLDKKYYQMNDLWQSLQDQIASTNKEIIAEQDGLKKEDLVSKRNILRVQSDTIKKDRIALFDGMQIIARAHDIL